MNTFPTMRSCLWLSTLFCALISFSVNAQIVVLKAKTGNVRVDGTLVEYDGEFYKVETDLGIMKIDARTVNCTGDGCPTTDNQIAEFSIHAMGTLGQTLTPTLIEAFTLSLEGEITTGDIFADGQTITAQDHAGQDIAKITISVKSEIDIFTDLAKGGSLIGATSRPPTKPEIAATKTAGFGNLLDTKQQQILAIDGIVAVVSPTNPLKTIALPELRKILTGEISNWRDIGGPDADIDLYLPKTTSAFTTTLATSALAVKPDQVSAKATQLESLGKVADTAASSPFAIGITSFSNLRNATALGLKGSCDIYSQPSVFTLKSGGYPLTYKHYFFHSQQQLPLFAREFLEFAKSDQAQNVIRSLGYGNLSISALSLDHQGLRLANTIGQSNGEVPLKTIVEMVKLQNGAERLSTTFRFLPESNTLDAQSLQNAELLNSALILGNYADKQVHLIGYTDAAGGSTKNAMLAKKHAETVLAALRATAPDGSLDDVDFHISGFGEASPLACEDTEAGKQVNRRVEVWIKDS